MPELRKDPIIDRWVIISTERGRRPTDFYIEKDLSRGGFCAFCPGNEQTTPPEVMAYGRCGEPNTPGWSLRVVPNKFPALIIEGDPNRVGEGVYDKMEGIGAHEVIIETPNHEETVMSTHKMAEILRAYQDRIRDLSGDKRFRYILIFKNRGRTAGASLEHPHSQLIALPIVPELVEEELHGSKRYFEYKERCVFCDVIRQERSENIRVVAENEQFIALSAYAPRAPFETWILPKRHLSSYLSVDQVELMALGELFSETLGRLDRTLPGCPYNYILHTSPLKKEELEYYHWHFELMPKLTMIAGFEWGTGFYINPLPPEDATKFLKEAKNKKIEG
jgi:UDPglucose--hexose-1-phosphate uridylyltransferase